MRPIVVIATSNSGKAREFLFLLRGWPGAFQTLVSFPDMAMPAEVGATLRDNARIKAGAIARQLAEWTLADDTGLEVDALGGAPGARSARFAGPNATSAENRERLVSMLDSHPEPWTARFVCRLALADPSGAIVCEAEGECRGRIIRTGRGTGGFGYDGHFVPEGQARTLAELSLAETAEVGHRGQAVRELKAKLAADEEMFLASS